MKTVYIVTLSGLITAINATNGSHAQGVVLDGDGEPVLTEDGERRGISLLSEVATAEEQAKYFAVIEKLKRLDRRARAAAQHELKAAIPRKVAELREQARSRR